MSQVIKVGAHQFAVELDWAAILAAGSPKKALSAAARDRKARLFASHRVNPNLKGLTPDANAYGFFIGKQPRGKLYSLASSFAQMASEKESLLVMPASEQQVIIVGIKNGRPVLDQLVTFEDLASAVSSYKMTYAPEGALLYVMGNWGEQDFLRNRVQSGFSSVYSGEEIPLLTRTDESCLLAGAGGMADIGMSQFIALGVALIGAYFVLDTWVFPDAPAVPEITPDQAYALSRDQALATSPRWTANSALPQLMARLGQQQAALAGWHMSSVTCDLNAPVENVNCTVTWSSDGGAMDDLHRAVPSVIFSPTGAATSTLVLQIKAQPAVRDSKQLPTAQDVFIRTGSDFSRLEAAGLLKPGMKSSGLVGTIPQTQTPLAEVPIEAGEWSIGGPLGFILDPVQLLPNNFALASLKITFDAGSGDAFVMTGTYYTKRASK